MSDKVKDDKKMSIKHEDDEEYKLRLNISCVGRLFALEQGRMHLHLPTKVKGDYRRVCDEIIHLKKNNYPKNKYAHASIYFLLHCKKKEFDVCRKNYTNMLKHHSIECSSEQHASSCLLSFAMFPAIEYHGTVPPERGDRISLQIQIERNDHYYFGESPKEVCCAIAQDLKDPLFQLIIKMTEKVFNDVSKGKKMNSFTAINKAAYWTDHAPIKGKHDLKENGIKEFYKACEDSIKHLGDNKKLGTLPHFLLNNLCLGVHQIKDLRAIFVGSECAFGPHNDIGHQLSTDKSVTLHGNIWFSDNYKSGDVNLQVEDFNKTDETFSNANGTWVGHFGDVYSTHCKSEEKLLFGQDAYNRKRLGIENFVDIVPPRVKNATLKHDNNACVKCVPSKRGKKNVGEMKGKKTAAKEDIKCVPSKRGKKNVGEMKGKKTAAKETKVCKPWKRVTLKFSGEGEEHNIEKKLH